jgi:hypothetical protein
MPDVVLHAKVALTHAAADQSADTDFAIGNHRGCGGNQRRPPVRHAARSIVVRTLSIQLFSNTGLGSGTVVSRSDMDGRLSSER